MPRRRLFLAALFALIPLTTAAQEAYTLRGTVLDPTGAAISGAEISVVPAPSAETTPIISSQTGEFSLALPPGRRTVTVSARGFKPATFDVTAQIGRADARTVTLDVEGFRDVVNITAPARYTTPGISSATKTLTPLRDVPQSVTVVTRQLIADQLMHSVADTVRYMPGISVHQGEGNRDQVIIRGNNSSADFFVDGVRDDVQYYRDLYNLDRVEAIKGPNATMFGRGGGGGVINRVTKEASFMPMEEFSLQGGTYSDRRIAGDVNQPLSDRVAFRLNGMYENDGSFRNGVTLERYAVNPTFTVAPDAKTKLTFGYENLYDHRVSDRGVTSYRGRPVDVDPSTVYGNPAVAWVNARVNLFSANVDHQTGRLRIHNRTLVGHYDRGYQNFVPGAVNADATLVTMTAYNNATKRTNVFNQTDATYPVSTGRLAHTLLAGVEFGSQLTDNLRNTGFFNNTSTSITIPFANTLVTTPVTFRPSATDADNHLRTNVVAAYTQDQIQVSTHVQVVAGVRYDYFNLNYHDNRSGLDLSRPDNLVSPRAAVVFKPSEPVSVYSSYTMSYLPSSGDQFSSLTTITQQVKPEQFNNYELGVKWDARDNLSFNTAVYRLDRTNTRSTDPNDPTRIIQTGSQRTNGFELGVSGFATGLWQVAGGYAYQDAFISSPTVSAVLGAAVGQVPHHTLSLWNRYQFAPRVGAGIGVLYRSDMFAAIDNTVTLPGYVRADAALFITLSSKLRVQANVENIFDRRYFINADSNTNISPGSPRALRIALTTRF